VLSVLDIDNMTAEYWQCVGALSIYKVVLLMMQMLGKHEKPYDGMLTSYQSDDLDCTRYMAVASNQS
jgi:hypothetical protein